MSHPSSVRAKPLSPHLQVYKPQLTSILSILHRLTGLFLGAGLMLLTWWLYGAAFEPSIVVSFAGALTTLWGKALLSAFLFAFWYHMLNGVRHLVWDTGRWLDLKAAYRSGYGVVAFSLILTAGSIYLIWFL